MLGSARKRGGKELWQPLGTSSSLMSRLAVASESMSHRGSGHYTVATPSWREVWVSVGSGTGRLGLKSSSLYQVCNL